MPYAVVRSVVKSNLLSIVAFAIVISAFEPIKATERLPTKKKTVCTVTINSSNEADAFRKHLSPDQWNFVELTNPDKTGVKSWFKDACEKQVTCDILIFSGHFGGSFFGTDTELRLSMEDLESASCKKSCSGITEQPKEVFLFGCNTLAGKDKDTRTPEQYRQVLIADGFSPSQASQIAAFRYSAFGASFRGRMAQVFKNTPRIYGFSALAPSGTTADPLLQRYFTRSREFYGDFDRRSQRLGTSQNLALLQAFTNTTLVQLPGLEVTMDSLNSKKSDRTEAPYCVLGADTSTRLAKLQYIKTELHAGRAFTFISHIDKFIKASVANGATWNADERLVVQEIGRDPVVKRDFEKYLKLPGDVYLPVRVNVLNLMMGLDLITPSEHSERIMKTIGISLARPLTRQIVDNLCSLDIQADLDVSQIPDSQWSSYEMFGLIQCLHPSNAEIHRRLAEIMMNSKESSNSFNASWTLAQLPVTDPKVHRMLADAAIGAKDPDLRRRAIDTLGDINPTDTSIVRNLADIMKSDPDWSIRQEAAYAFRTIKTEDPAVLRTLVDVMLHDKEWAIRAAAADALRFINSIEPSVQVYRKIWEGRIP